VKRKNLNTILLVASILTAINSGKALAAKYTNDVTPPYGRISIVGASTDENGEEYVTGKKVNVEIYAKDDMCEDTEIKYYLSEEPINIGEQIEEWNSYVSGENATFTFENYEGSKKVYAIFKDANGNTSVKHTGEQTEFSITYNANGGTGDLTTANTIASYGQSIVVTSQTPKMEGKYFIGWSIDANATAARFRPREIIPAETFVGTNRDIVLYAVWSENYEDLPLLADSVDIGDYVDYPVYYDNVDQNGNTTGLGWRVISKDIDLNGNESIGTVNLISTGVPLVYNGPTAAYSNGDASVAETELTNNFLSVPMSGGSSEEWSSYYTANRFNENLSLTEVFTNKYTALKSDGTPNVRSVKKEDIIRLGNVEEDSYIGIEKFYDLIHVDTEYFLASPVDSSALYVYSGGEFYCTTSDADICGVRPVVSLKKNVRANATNEMGAWKLELQQKETTDLSSVVSVGDYVDYNVTYQNIADTDGNLTSYTGWRVLSKDVDIDGNESVGTINIVSAGAPLSYYHGYLANTTIKNLVTNFTETVFDETGEHNFRSNGFTDYASLQAAFENDYTATRGDGTLAVRAMTEDDLKLFFGINDQELPSSLDLTGYDNLFTIGESYWLGSNVWEGTTFWIVKGDGTLTDGNNKEFPVRVVVSLKPGSLTTGKNGDGAWVLE